MRIPVRLFARSHLAFATVFALLLLLSALPAKAQNADNGDQDKNLDVHLHVGKDGDARTAGLPVYPGAHLKHNDEDKENANFALLAGTFGLKLVVAHYDSGDSPDKVIGYYRERLKKFGKVLECHTSKSGDDVHVNSDNHDSKDSKELKCDSGDTGGAVELKAGTEDNQHVVSVEPAESGKGSAFALVYLYKRSKQGDI